MTPRTIVRWSRAGLLPTLWTAGGQRRVNRTALADLARDGAPNRTRMHRGKLVPPKRKPAAA